MTAPAGPARVLVVDDEPMVHHAIARTLQRWHTVVETDGPGALRRFEAGERFDAVMCDIVMPGVSGIDLYQRVMTMDPAQARRFVFVTGGVSSVQATKFLAATRNPVVEKPFTATALIAALSQALAHGSSA